MSQKRKFDEDDRVASEEPPLKAIKSDQSDLILNTDMVLEIIKHLDLRDVAQLEEVNKSLQKIAWPTLRAIDLELHVDQVPLFLKSVTKATNVEVFNLRIKHDTPALEFNQESRETLAQYLRSCSRLTELTFHGSYFGEVNILSNLKGLKSVHIIDYDNKPLDELFNNNSNELISLKLSNWAMHKLTGLSAVSNLTSLALIDTMIDCEGEEVDPLPEIFSTLTQLKQLTLKEFDLFDMTGITKLQNLTALDLTEARLHEDEEYGPGFKAVAKLPNLRSLNLTGVEGLTRSVHNTLSKLSLDQLILPEDEPISDEDGSDDDSGGGSDGGSDDGSDDGGKNASDEGSENEEEDD